MFICASETVPSACQHIGEGRAFKDTWSWSPAIEVLYDETVTSAPRLEIRNTILGLMNVLGKDRLMAYIVNMTAHLIEMRRLLKPSGCIYLHCDPNASHYLKLVMDAVFGRDNFRNEIMWAYRTGGGE